MREYIFGEINFIGEGSQIRPTHTSSAIVRTVDAKYLINGTPYECETLAEQIMLENGYPAYLCIEAYNGRVILMDEDGNERVIARQVGASAF